MSVSNVRPAVICRNSNVNLKVSTVEKAGSLILFTIVEIQALEFLNIKSKVLKLFVTYNLRPAVICGSFSF